MKKILFYLFSFYFALFVVNAVSAQEMSTFGIDPSKLPKVSCNTTKECHQKATLAGFCKVGKDCPLLCEQNLCIPDLSCQTTDDCVKKAEAINLCQKGSACDVECKLAQCLSKSPTAATPTPDPSAPNDSDIEDALNKTLTCGRIGESCCDNGTLPKPRLKSPVFIFDPIVGIINGAISVVDKIIDWASTELKLITDPCIEGKPSSSENVPSCRCLPIETYNVAKLCLQIDNKNEQTACINCSKNGVWTAIGCFEGTFSEFLTKNILGWGVGLAGVLSMMCIIYAAIKMQLSRGNPDKLKTTQEMLTSCITGLLLIIFSVFILRILGVDVLRIPGLN